MSYEFIATLPEAVPDSSSLLQALARRLPLEVVPAPDGRLLLRWTDQPKRVEWPEDIELSCNPDGIVVSVHAGTASQRLALLDALADELAKRIGTPVSFEEQ